MIILDTNVLSALMRKAPDAAVVAWLDQQPPESIWITSITLFEARLGLALLPEGKRRVALTSAFARLLEEDLENRVLDFDIGAAIEAANLAARRQLAGRAVDIRDTQIAAIALARRATLATRNTRHFANLAINVIDPWKTPERYGPDRDSAPSMASPAHSAYAFPMTARTAKPAAVPPPAPRVKPTPAQEKAAFIRSLEKHGQAVEGDCPLPAGATHTLKKRADGKKVVKRKRFSAV